MDKEKMLSKRQLEALEKGRNRRWTQQQKEKMIATRRKKGNFKRSNISKKKQSETRKQLFKKGRLKVWNDGLTKYTDKRVENNIKGFNGENHPMKNPKIRKKMSQSIKNLWRKYPEKHPNRNFGNKKSITKPQIILFQKIKNEFPEQKVELNFPVKTINSVRFIDVAIPQTKKGFEYDEPFWHQDINKDLQRDKELHEVNWSIKHIRGMNNLNEYIQK